MSVAPVPGALATLAAWVTRIVADPDPVTVADAAAAIGALLALGTPTDQSDHAVRAALRSAGDLPVPMDACCRAAYSAGGLAALGELLAGRDDARCAAQVLPNRTRPLDERLIDALARHGPMRRSDLVRAVDAPPTTVTRALVRLGNRGMVQVVHIARGTRVSAGHRRPAVAYALTSAGTAAAK